MALSPGFDPSEAKTFIAIMAQLEDAPPPQPPIPPNWVLDFDAPELGPFDNKYQLWKNTEVPGQYALAIRGTVDKKGSILEDLLSVMIPAQGTVTLGPVSFSYTFAQEPNAGVHLGFTLGLGFLLFDGLNGILVQLVKRIGVIEELYITGHSQGAAVATLCRSFFQYSKIVQDLGLSYKTYLFAQPKPGNDHYAYDFAAIPGNTTMAWNVTNSLDWVPQVPLTFEWLDDLNQPNPASAYLGGDPLVHDLHAMREKMRADAAVRQLVRYAPHMAALGAVLAAQKIHPFGAPTGAPRILHTLYFQNAGAPLILTGVPCPTPDCGGDSWFQHHTTTYYDLLVKEFPD